MPRAVRAALLAGTGVLLAHLLWAAVVLLAARDDARAAERELDAARAAPDAATALAHLRNAQDYFASVRSDVTAPGPRLVAALPAVGRTVTAVQRGAEAGEAVSGALTEVIASVQYQSVVREGGAIDAEAARVLEAALRAAADDVAGPVRALSEIETGLVPGAVADRVRAAEAQLDGLPQDLRRGAAAVAGLRALTGGGGSRGVLLAVQNNAELRATGGLVSVFAELTAHDGRIEIGPFRDVEDVADPPAEAERVPAPADYRALWGPYLADSTLWKNTNMAPDVPTSSAVLAEVAGASLGAEPDVVVWLDVRALAAVLAGTSGTTLEDGTEIDGDNAVDVLLSGSYSGVDDQDARRAQLREVADAVADRLLGTPPDLTRLAPELAAATAGRHLAVWAARPEEQATWRAAGLAAPVEADGGDLSSMAVHNLGGGDRDGNKLDYYARRSVDVDVVVGLQEARVVQRMELRNEAPASGLPPYVAGGVAPGVTNNLVSFALPSEARSVRFARGHDVLDVSAEPAGDHLLVRDVVSLAPGASVTWEITYSLPVDGTYRLRVVPQPLAVDADVQIAVRAADGVRLETEADELELDVLDRQVEVRADVREQTWARRLVDGVRRFWSEPVELP